MRKIVCSQCAKDWAVQHVCVFGPGNYSHEGRPTVIWEPDEREKAGSHLALLTEERDRLKKILRDWLHLLDNRAMTGSALDAVVKRAREAVE